MDNLSAIYNILHRCGISGKYRGFAMLLSAIQMSIEDDAQGSMITQSLYSRVAEECRCPIYCVERNIRTVVMRAWKTNRTYLQEMAGYLLVGPPTSSEFIVIITTYILCERCAESNFAKFLS